MLKRVLTAVVISLALAMPSHAQTTKAANTTDINTNWPDNTVGTITPAIARTTLLSLVNSMQQYPGVNPQTGTTYTIATTDYGQLVTFNNASPVAVTLPQATGSFATFNVYVSSLGAGAVTITPTTSTINGAATLVVNQGQSLQIVSDGTNYQVIKGTGTGTIASVTITVPAIFSLSGSPCTTATCTFTETLATQTANTIWAGPTTGAAATPTFRAQVSADLPTPYANLASGTSGGIPYFSSTSALSSSALLTANAIVLGGGAATAPSALGSLGTTTTVLHGNAAGPPTFGAVSLTADVSGLLPLANGGCNANLTASNGGLLYSTASACAILAGTATANQIPLSGSSAPPAWSTATYPATTTINRLLYSSAANTITDLATANNGTLITSAGGVPSISSTLPNAVQDNITRLGTVTSGTWTGTTIAIANGGTAQTTANAARQSSGLNIWGDQGTGHGDTNATIGNTERLAYTNAAFSAARTWTLPAANVTGQPYSVMVADMAGGVTGVNTLTVQRAGADTINGGTTVSIAAANGAYICYSDGTSKWSCQSVGPASAGGVSSITCNGGLTGGAITTSGTCAVDIATNSNLWAATANKIVDAAGLNSGQLALVTLTDAATVAVDFNTGKNFSVTLGGNRTLGNPTNVNRVGDCGRIYVVQDGTGSRTLAYSSNWKFTNGNPPVLSTAASAVDIIYYCIRTSTFIEATLMTKVSYLRQFDWPKVAANDNGILVMKAA